jgi:hypothetical protein
LTPVFAKLSISPESSDGFASVGTILPKEEAALLPGGLFVFYVGLQEGIKRLNPESDWLFLRKREGGFGRALERTLYAFCYG